MIDSLEADLRSAMDASSDHLELPEGIARQAWAAGRRARPGTPKRGMRSRLHRLRREVSARYTRPQLAFTGAAFAIVVVVIAAFALGGSTNPLAKSTVTNGLRQQGQVVTVPGTHGRALGPTSGGGIATGSGSTGTSAGGSGGGGNAGVPKSPSRAVHGSTPVLGSAGAQTYAPHNAAPSTAPGSSDSLVGVGAGATDFQVGTGRAVVDSGVTATRVVKTGSLSMTVHKGLVGSTITKLTTITSSLGGYVSQSRTDDVDGSPAGSLTLRIPVTRFEDAVTAATGLGHETSLATNAHDVTGKFVDLNARLSALKRTRSTYLTILGQARTIGQTLSVQQRVNDIQQQIESRQGELKVLRNQSADGTLTVDVSEIGAATPAIVRPHHRSGWSKAWHNSTSRFNRGIQAIIGGLGPLLLVLILLALLYLLGRVVTRGSRRSTSAEE